MNTCSKNNCLEKLKTNIFEIKFEKKDGSIRIMICTLIPELLPKKQNSDNELEVEKKKSENIQIAFDLEVQAFRSFNIDKLLSYKILTTEEVDDFNNLRNI